MEDLLRCLRSLGLKPPDPSQLLELLDEEEKVQEHLARTISLSTLDYDIEANDAETSSDRGLTALMGQDLLQEAVSALLENFRKTLKRQQQLADREKKKECVRIKWPPRKALLARQEAALQRLEREKLECPNYRPRLIFDGTESHYSTSDLCQLESISVKDLIEVPKRYQGRYLLCKVITSLLLYAGVTFIAEDTSGSAVPVSISHFTSNLHLSTEDVSSLLPVGSIIAIKEPFVSLHHQSRTGPCSGKGEVGIRIDSPTDIIQITEKVKANVFSQESSSKEHIVEDWLRSGVSVFKDIDQFQKSIEQLLEEERFGEAFRRLARAKEAGVSINLAVEARMLFKLDAWQAARDLLLKIEQIEMSRPDGVREGDEEIDSRRAADFSACFEELTVRQARKRCDIRIKQSEHGPSPEDINSIYFAAANGTRHLDTSEYIGPVAVRKIPGAGRGLVTTRPVKAGELLLLCKAVCPTYSDDKECDGLPLMRLNFDNGVVSTTSQVRAQTKLIHAIVDRPELASSIFGLTAGPNIADSNYVSKEYPIKTSFDLSMDTKDEKGRLDIDAKYIDGVLRFNAFGPAQYPSRKGASVTGELQRSTMPHPLPAILNHACFPNVSSVFLSNIVITRALSDLPVDWEIVHQYVRGEESLAIRTANLSKHGFECGCKLCILDREDGLDNCQIRARIVHGESKAILDRSAVLLKSSSLDGIEQSANKEADAEIIESLERLIAGINATYSTKRGPIRPDLFTAMDARTRHLARISVGRTLESAKEALCSVGATLKLSDEQEPLEQLPRLHFDPSLALILFIADVLVKSGSVQLSQAWTRCAFRAHQCMIGGGLDVFLDRWGIEKYRAALDLPWHTKQQP